MAEARTFHFDFAKLLFDAEFPVESTRAVEGLIGDISGLFRLQGEAKFALQNAH